MADTATPDSFAKGQAPWEQGAITTAPDSFPAGQAPWEQGQPSQPMLDAKEHPILKGALDYLPAAGSVTGGILGATAGSILPGAGTVGGEVAGSAAGGAAGSLAKDALNSWIFGESKSARDVAKSAGIEGVIGGVAQGVGAGLGAGAKALAATKLGSAALQGAGDLAASAGETVFRVPAVVIKRYAQAAAEIAGLSAKAGGSVADATNLVKKGYAESLGEFRTEMNTKINTALADSDAEVSSKPMIEALEKAKLKLNPKIDADAPALSSIDAQIAQVKKLEINRGGVYGPENTGKISVQDANDLKRTWQDAATTAYRDAEQGSTGSNFANAAKEAAKAARKLVNDAVPELGTANNQLALLHNIEDSMNRSLLKQGANQSGLITVGKGADNQNASVLRRLSALTGQDFIGQAQNLGAMSAFDTAGMQLKRASIGAAAGTAAGAAAGYELGDSKGSAMIGAGIGGTLGAAVTSPLMLRKSLDTFRGMSNVLDTAAGGAAGRQTLGQSVIHGTGGVNAIRKTAP
jgi:hypothetical protein